MKNILLPTDFSENSWNAIKYAINFFEKDTCHFYLLHVNRVGENYMNGSPYIVSEEVLEDVYVKPTKQKLHSILKRIVTELPANTNHKFHTLFDYNFFIDSIRKHVEEKNIDLIVMGTKGSDGLRKIVMGSNTGDVIKKVKCNVLTVPEKATFNTIKEIAFPSDFSLTYNIQILQPLLDILEHNKASLRVLHISKNKTDLNAEQLKNRELLEDYFTSIESSFHYLTNRKLEDAVQCFIDSREINMICMVAKNLNYFQQILFHSQIEELSYHLKIPFLVLHETP
ncbi:universal stress protein [Aestuariibaculum lutulentum]|uniref:Universal stress protein n=1 Tax=Aestuariibaculum lutulentum TaxID=2920935 RepID=A0ABS9RLS2_9FLAO|nr:universal stress protein [Aestuariibaculum lutulentum]MCH4553888.1 universal stress protein [Aestuariibaculum lutulentum]